MSGWTEARDNMLRKLWNAGKTGKQIAILMGLTRNAVIGRAHRLGLDKRANPIKADANEIARNRKLGLERRRNGDPKPVNVAPSRSTPFSF